MNFANEHRKGVVQKAILQMEKTGASHIKEMAIFGQVLLASVCLAVQWV